MRIRDAALEKSLTEDKKRLEELDRQIEEGTVEDMNEATLEQYKLIIGIHRIEKYLGLE